MVDWNRLAVVIPRDSNAITLKLPKPVSSNRYWRTTRRGITYVSADATKYKAAVGAICFQQDVEAIIGPVSVAVECYLCERRDLDNCAKVLLDALQGHAFANDKQVEELHLYRHKVAHRKEECVIVTVRAMVGG